MCGSQKEVSQLYDRAFGVEIECGYDGDGGSSCSCYCWCESEREYMRDQNWEIANAPAGTYYASRMPYSDEEIENYECEYCRYGCSGDCDGCYDDNAGCETAASLLYDHGFHEWTDEIHPDGSGVEIPSPILRGREGLRELQQVMELLERNGFHTSASDGMHVHHDAPEWVEDDSLVAHTLELWEENLPMIHQFVAPNRRTSTMCASYKEPRYSWEAEQWENFKKTKDPTILREKFRALNICHLPYSGSLEIRLHEGTLDFQKAAAWIRFGQAFLNFALKTHKQGELVVCNSRTDLLNRARVSSTTRRRLMAVAGRKVQVA